MNWRDTLSRNELERSVLNGGVMPGFINGLSDLVPKFTGTIVLGDVLRRDDPRRITGPRGSHRVVKRSWNAFSNLTMVRGKKLGNSFESYRVIPA